VLPGWRGRANPATRSLINLGWGGLAANLGSPVYVALEAGLARLCGMILVGKKL